MKNNIVRDFKLKKTWLKNEYKKLMYCSIMHNLKINRYCKFLIKNYFIKKKLKNSLSAQKRTCIVLGKNRSVYPKINLKRHTIKKLNKTCLITNISMAKW